MYLSKSQQHEMQRAESLSDRVAVLKDSLKAEKDRVTEADYFSLQNNSNAIEYFKGQDINRIAIKVRDGIYALNKSDTGNTLIQYPPIDGRPFLINKMKVLNNRWVIADFSNGQAWGEVLIKYFVDNEGNVSFETAETLLHSNTLVPN
jgi:hypothetical protein